MQFPELRLDNLIAAESIQVCSLRFRKPLSHSLLVKNQLGSSTVFLSYLPPATAARGAQALVCGCPDSEMQRTCWQTLFHEKADPYGLELSS